MKSPLLLCLSALGVVFLASCATTETTNKKPPPPPPGGEASTLPWSRMERPWETGIPGLSGQQSQ